MMKQVTTVGERLKAYRTDNNYTLKYMGYLTGLSPQRVNSYELGKRVPKADIVCFMAECLDVDIRWLLGYDVNMEGKPMAN